MQLNFVVNLDEMNSCEGNPFGPGYIAFPISIPTSYHLLRFLSLS